MFSCWVWRDDRLTAPFGQPVTEFAGVVGAIRDQPLRRWNERQQGRRAGEIMNLAGRHRKGDGSSRLIGYGVNLGRPSAARSSDGLFEGPPFAPEAERCALT